MVGLGLENCYSLSRRGLLLLKKYSAQMESMEAKTDMLVNGRRRHSTQGQEPVKRWYGGRSIVLRLPSKGHPPVEIRVVSRAQSRINLAAAVPPRPPP